MLELLEEIPGQTRRPSKRKWHCRCYCGTEFAAFLHNVKGGRTKSCGCYRREIIATRSLSHGQSRSRTYGAWAQMVQRCTGPNNQAYAHYGGRGIRVCDRWQKFENFSADMGERPEGTTLDRADNDGDYCPENCRWATRKQQGRNKRSNRLLTHGGETLCMSEWAERTGIAAGTIRYRLEKGWTVEETLTTLPRGKRT